MTISALGLKMAKQKAELFLRENNYSTLPIDPLAIASKYNIAVQAKPSSAEGVSGMLLRHGSSFGIMYATNIASEGFQRFSVAHELGHYFLDGHLDHVLPIDGNGVHVSHAGFTSGDSYELEADYFAAGLLMPSNLFKRELKRADSGLTAIEALAGICKTSITATAIRYAELTDDAVAVVISTGPVIDYCFMSDAMKSLPQLTWLKKGSPVPRGTQTFQLNADPKNVEAAKRISAEIDVMDWLGGIRSVIIAEEVVGLGSYGKTLTVLSSESIGQQAAGWDDEEDDENLIASWKPRFRK
jgi:Zn-dependent peptidase ImmA (M78 family)